MTSTIFEAIMLICFGSSWPFAVYKTVKSRSVAGISIIFLWFLFVGYISGVMFKITEAHATGHLSPVIALYLFNLILVGTEVFLYYRYRN